MKNGKQFNLNLIFFIGALLLIVAGVVTIVLTDNNRLTALGGLMICLAGFFLIMGIARVAAKREANKEEKERAKRELAEKRKLEAQIDEALKTFQSKTELPEPNTVRLIDAGMVFCAEGRYVCEKDFKNVNGLHFAFEISSTALKSKPDGYDDVCDLEGVGILVEAGYHDGVALEKYANDNGIVLSDGLLNSVGKTLTLTPDKGYKLEVQTAESDEVGFGFVKLLKCENDILTVYFSMNVPCGLCDTVEGIVELRKDECVDARDISSLIKRIKRKRFNSIALSEEDVKAIKQANPFLPESYITFIREVGFVDCDWIDVGWNAGTPTNLNDDDTGCVNDILANYKAMKIDDFYFVGLDSGGTYYALSKNADDKKVYIFSDDANDIGTYASFEEFVYEILNV